MCVSYKEQSEGSTDEEDLIDASEQADDAASQEESDAETIEKVIRHRIGRKGGMSALQSSNVFSFIRIVSILDTRSCYNDRKYIINAMMLFLFSTETTLPSLAIYYTYIIYIFFYHCTLVSGCLSFYYNFNE